MMKKLSLFLLLTSIQLAVAAQQYSPTENGVSAVVNEIHIELQVYGPGMIRVIKLPEDSVLHKVSLSVVAKPAPGRFELSERSGVLKLQTRSIICRLDLKTGKVSFLMPDNKPLFTEKDYGAAFSGLQGVDSGKFDVRQAFLLDPDEVIYGLGEQQNGRLNQRNQRNLLVQQNMKVAIPFFQSVKGYGVFWDNYSPTLFTDNKWETSFDSEVGSCVDYYFMYGGSTDSVVAKMRHLTGQAPLLPLWVYGYNQSRERYKTQYELVDVVRRYRALHVPLDGIIQDWQYWGKDSNWNAMRFDPETYPAPEKMIDSIHQMQAHLFIVAWPGFGPETRQYKYFDKNNMLLRFDTWPPNSGAKVYDVYDPAARKVYWDYLNKGLFALGADAWWLDSSEPDHLNEKDKDFDQQTYLGSYRSVRNAFPLEHIMGVYEHQRETTSKKRVAILTRSAFAGQQRYSAITWSGDIRSDWKVFHNQIAAGLNFSLTGIPYWNTDIGGFFAGDYKRHGGVDNPEFRELYTRWFQFGTFMPMMRSHGTDIPREIYQFGKKGDAIYDILDKFICLRYSLLPYIYATAWNITAHAGSFMRPLVAEFKSDKNVADIGDEYMFGKSFLVAPVTVKGAAFKDVYLPAGSNWYDFWTGELINGGTTVKRSTPLSLLPVYIKSGSIIPWGPSVEYALEKNWDNLQIRIYPGAAGDFTLYEDENDNYHYEKGAFSVIRFHWDDQTKTLTIGNRQGQFPGMLQTRKFSLVVVSKNNGVGSELSATADKIVSYQGNKLLVHFK